jgi:hypothetical protein
MQRIFFCDRNAPASGSAALRNPSRAVGAAPRARFGKTAPSGRAYRRRGQASAGRARQERDRSEGRTVSTRKKVILAIVLALASLAMYVSVFVKISGG